MPYALVLFIAVISLKADIVAATGCSSYLAAWSADSYLLKKQGVILRSGRAINLPHYEAIVDYYGGAAIRVENNSHGYNKWFIFVDGADGRIEVDARRIMSGSNGFAALISVEGNQPHWRVYLRDWISASQFRRNIPVVINIHSSNEQRIVSELNGTTEDKVSQSLH